MRNYRALVIDDEGNWRKVIARSLGGEFQTDSAANTQDARLLIAERLYHLIVLDISMEAGDPANIEGLEFLRELYEGGTTETCCVIVLSAFGTLKRMREAFALYGIADFLEKQKFDNRALPSIVKSKVIEKIKTNLSLEILWQGVAAANEACIGLRIRGQRIRREAPLYERLGVELEELLCRLFHDAERIIAQPLPYSRSGDRVLRVQPFYAAAEGRSTLVKFGEVFRVEHEANNFQQYVRPFLDRSTLLESERRMPLLGGIHYSLLGAADDFEDFGSFYRSNSASDIRNMLDKLFLHTCAPWYANAGSLRPVDLSSEYQNLLNVTPQKLEEAVQKGLKAVHGKEKLLFSALAVKQELANPIPLIVNRSFVRSTYLCITHGDLDLSNILVDRSGTPWLIDFYRTGPGHILRDFAQLEVSIRIVLLAPEEATLDERLQLEQTLLGTRHLGEVKDPPEGTFPALAKCYSTILHLRSLADRQYPRNDIEEYYIALVYFALNLIRFWSLSTVQREHALLSAALIAEQIASPPLGES